MSIDFAKFDFLVTPAVIEAGAATAIDPEALMRELRTRAPLEAHEPMPWVLEWQFDFGAAVAHVWYQDPSAGDQRVSIWWTSEAALERALAMLLSATATLALELHAGKLRVTDANRGMVVTLLDDPNTEIEEGASAVAAEEVPRCLFHPEVGLEARGPGWYCGECGCFYLQAFDQALPGYLAVTRQREQSGDLEGALTAMAEAVAINPENPALVVNFAELCVRASRVEQALGQFERAAELLEALGRSDDWVRVLERAAYLDKGAVGIRRRLAGYYIENNHPRRALAALQLCYQLDPEDPEILRLVAIAFEQSGSEDKALVTWKELATLNDERGEEQAGRAAWQRVLALAPDDPDVPPDLV